MTREFRRKIVKYVGNLVIVGVAVAAVWFGSQALAPLAAISSNVENPATPVRTVPIVIDTEIPVQRHFLGRLEAQQVAALGFEFDGALAEFQVREGDRVRRGQVLARMSTDLIVAERDAVMALLTAAEARLAVAEIEAERSEKLVASGNARDNRLDSARAERDILAAGVIEARSRLEQVELRLQKSTLVAPFDGIVGARGATIGEAVGAGQPVVTVYQSDAPVLRAGLPVSLDLAAFRNPQIEVNGQSYPVRLRAVRPDIDPRTNAQIAIFDVDADDLQGFGQSVSLQGEVLLAQTGAWLPMSALRPGTEGFWTVLAVDANGLAERVAVEVLHLREDRVFVTGSITPGMVVISDGAHKVVPGQRVRFD